jgi:hypothetical protein
MNYSFFLLSVILLAECFQITTAIDGGCDCSKAKYLVNGKVTSTGELCGWYMGPKDKSKPKDCLENTIYNCWPQENPKSIALYDCTEYKQKCNNTVLKSSLGVRGKCF